jgi:hypothetical protein
MRIADLLPVRSAVIATCILPVLLLTIPVLDADEAGLEVNEPAWTGKTLERQMGKRVKLKLRLGQEIEGTVAKVGAHAVHLAQLAGMDFYDAAVCLDDVSTVIVKARGK